MTSVSNIMNAPEDALRQQLARGVAALRLTLTPAQRSKLLGFVELLAKWNHVYNLTAVRNPSAMITRHLLDSLAVVPFIKGPRVLDVGTGAGLPGIPLAVALPDLEFVLLDSVAKKTRFVVQASSELQISNVVVKTQRVEKYQLLGCFDTVISRAFSSMTEFVTVAGALCRRNGGVLVAMKGRHPQDELAMLPPGYRIKRISRVAVPGLDEERHVVQIIRE
ncbi:MAG: 16S rRNA (guanine(527)-N(7))-methyltransferase RsmG [Gammaproteobacteria bacterium]